MYTQRQKNVKCSEAGKVIVIRGSKVKAHF